MPTFSYNPFDIDDVHDRLREVETSLKYVTKDRNELGDQVSMLEDIIFDMYLNDDGHAFKRAGRYLKKHRPDLWEKADGSKTDTS